MITRLKTECGYQFVSKMEGMWKDIKSISRDVHERYEAWTRRNQSRNKNKSDDDDGSGNGGVKINIRVLTTGFWPTTSTKISTDQTILPDSIVSACEHFQTFYSTHFTGRRLTWNKAMGQAVLYYRMDNKKQKELLVSTYQMCVLMLFNEEGTEVFERTFEGRNGSMISALCFHLENENSFIFFFSSFDHDKMYSRMLNL